MSDRQQCIGCEVIPKPYQLPGKLYLWLPTLHTQNKVIHVLIQNQYEYKVLDSEPILEIQLVSDLDGFTNRINEQLSSEEILHSRALFLEPEQTITLASFRHVVSLHEFLSFTQAEWLLEILNDNRLVSYFQPIVNTDNPNTIFAYECLLRGKTKSGEIISPFQMYNTARDTKLLFQLDRAARISSIRCSSEQNIQNRLFINFNPTSIYDPTSCLSTTLALINKVGIPPSSITFEVVETENIKSINHLKDILLFYRESGFSIALDDIGSGYSSLNMITELKPDFVKLDMELVRNIHQEKTKAVITAKIIEICHDLEIQCIAEGVEVIEEYQWLKDHHTNYIQGYLFAKPSAVPIRDIGFVPA